MTKKCFNKYIQHRTNVCTVLSAVWANYNLYIMTCHYIVYAFRNIIVIRNGIRKPIAIRNFLIASENF